MGVPGFLALLDPSGAGLCRAQGPRAQRGCARHRAGLCRHKDYQRHPHDLGFTSFAGLGWSAVTNVAVNSPIAFAVDLTPSAPYFIGQYSLSSGQGSSGLWGGIGIPDGTHDTVSGVPPM